MTSVTWTLKYRHPPYAIAIYSMNALAKAEMAYHRRLEQQAIAV